MPRTTRCRTAAGRFTKCRKGSRIAGLGSAGHPLEWTPRNVGHDDWKSAIAKGERHQYHIHKNPKLRGPAWSVLIFQIETMDSGKRRAHGAGHYLNPRLTDGWSNIEVAPFHNADEAKAAAQAVEDVGLAPWERGRR